MLRGQAVLADSLHKINLQHSQKRAVEPNAASMEIEILKAIKTLFGSQIGAADAYTNDSAADHITESLTSPSLPARDLTLQLLAFFVASPNGRGLSVVLKGLDSLQRARNATGRFDVWFKHFEEALDGRGRFGSLVGASDAVMSLRGPAQRESARAQANGRDGSLDGNLGEHAVS